MAELTAAVKAAFTGDSTFMALATNGVLTSDDLDADGLTLDDLTGATPVVQPTALIRFSTEGQFGARSHYAHRVFFEVYFYDSGDGGYSTIRQMRERAAVLLDQQPLTIDSPSGAWVFETRWAGGDLREQKDDRLGGAAFERSRFYAVMVTR